MNKINLYSEYFNIRFYVLLYIFSIPTFAQDSNSKVKIEAYLMDSDTTGTNVRNSPSGSIKTVLHFKGICTLAASIEISECSRNGWLLVTTLDDCVQRVTGWVHSSLVYIGITPGKGDPKTNYTTILPINLYQEASKASQKVYNVYSNKEVNILKCDGAWVYVKLKEKDKVVYGWLSPEDQCANPFTTCGP